MAPSSSTMSTAAGMRMSTLPRAPVIRRMYRSPASPERNGSIRSVWWACTSKAWPNPPIHGRTTAGTG